MILLLDKYIIADTGYLPYMATAGLPTSITLKPDIAFKNHAMGAIVICPTLTGSNIDSYTVSFFNFPSPFTSMLIWDSPVMKILPLPPIKYTGVEYITITGGINRRGAIFALLMEQKS